MKKKKRNNKVALIFPPAVSDAPYDDPSFDIWIINGCFQHAERFDLLFDMHDWVGADYVPHYYELLKDKDFPIVKPALDKDLKNVIVYPKELKRAFPHQLKHSACYMLAYAWYKHYQNIYIYGLHGDEFERHPYMGYAFYYILGIVTHAWCKEKTDSFPKAYFVNKMAMDNASMYGMDLEIRKSDAAFEGRDNFTIKRYEVL